MNLQLLLHVCHITYDSKLADIDELIEEIMRQKPEITKDEIMARVVAKKDAIGANYLTDRGAIFLIASECGVTIGKPVKSSVSIKEIYIGASEITLEARVLCISPVRQYTKKDGGQGALRTIIVYDSPEHTASVKLWNDKANLPGINELKTGDFVKITNANVKEDRDGTPAVHVGSNSVIEPVDVPQHEIPTVENIIKDISTLTEDKEVSNLAISGALEGDVSLLEYTRQQTGERATALKFRLRGNDNAIRRIVLWGKDMSSVPKKITTTSPKVTLLGVSTRITEQQGMEIHGNDSTQFTIEAANDNDNDTMEPITIRILAKPVNDSRRQAILGVDSAARLYSIIDNDQISAAYNENEIVECMPARMQGRNITLDSSSFIRNASSENAETPTTIPTLKDVLVSLLDAKPDDGKIYCIECIILNAPERREIQTKSGETIYLTEVGIGDGSGESVIKAWRNQSRMFEECAMGSKYIITGVRAQRGMGEDVIDLTLTEFSTIKPGSAAN